MDKFRGFPDSKIRFTPLPSQFFTELLPSINHAGELKVILYTFWRLDRMEGAFRYLKRQDFVDDERFMQGLAMDGSDALASLDDALSRCVARGALLEATLDLEEGKVTYYFLNSPKGRAAVNAIANGEWRPSGDPDAPLDFSLEHPNIFRLYEEHFGPLTPMIAERLRDAETTYHPEWIEDAMRIAIENNVRRWTYIEAILRRWQEEGRDERKDRRDTEKDRRRYVEGDFADFIEH